MATTFDWKRLSTTDKVISVTALIALISLFLPWFGASGPGVSYSASGGWGWLGAILILAAGAYVVLLRAGTEMPKFSYGPGVIVLGLSAVGAAIVILRWLTIQKGSIDGGLFSYGPRIGLYLALIAGIVQALFALRMFRASGEAVPWKK